MKKFFILISFIFAFNQTAITQNSHKDIWELLPKANELKQWHPGDSPEKYVGDDLYVFINGGAEIYYEYGFNQVVYNEYKHKNDHSINVEIYEMKSPESAFGIYSFKIGRKGETFPVGNDAFLQSYYMNFWKGNYLVILTGFDNSETTINGIKEIAKVINKKIKLKGKKPEIIKLLPKENLKITHIKYIKGVLGLFNQYNFGAENIFGISEGVIGSYKKHRLFIFKYNNTSESLKYFNNAKAKLKLNSLFSDINIDNHFISLKDQKDNFLSIKPFQDYILILLDEQEVVSENRFDAIQNHIKMMNEE